MPSTGSYRFATFLICGSLMVSSSAASANASISPWATLSAFGTAASRDAACAGDANAAPAETSGCMLAVAQPGGSSNDESDGVGVSPLVLALGALALAGLIYLIINGDEDDEGSPLSPP